MKLAFCISPLSSGHKTRGIGFYTKNLLENLKKIDDLQIEEFSDISEINKADVIHYPFFDLFNTSLPFIKKFPTVVTIHDVTPLVFPTHFPAGIKGKLKLEYQKASLRSVKAVITDSFNSSKDINKYLNFNKEKIFPIYLGASKLILDKITVSLKEKITTKYHLPNHFCLYIGHVNWNKNLIGLTEGALEAGCDIVLVGKDFEKQEDLNHPELKSYKEFLNKYSDNKKVHIKGFIEDKDLAVIIILANALLLPSFCEGFGLSILDAQFLGTPVITSNISSMPEVAGEGAILVNPYKTQEITEAIQSLSSLSLRESLIKKGYKNVSKFSWEKCAKETYDVYKKVILLHD
jgi:glycosyltransferase involved in cell wall biosynthesis